MALPKEVVPATASQRCPKCHKLTCTFDVENSRVVCNACGFEERLRV